MRYFPRAGRRRDVAWAALASLGLLSLLLISLLPIGATPGARAEDDLDHRAELAQDQLAEAEEALEGSSQRARQAASALASAEEKLSAARLRLSDAQAQLAEARHRDAVMRERLKRAEDRLAQARAELEAAKLQLEQQRVSVRSLVTDIYTQGDPDILAFSALLRSQTPADLTRQLELRNGVVSAETGDLRDLATLEIGLQLRENAVEQATDRVAGLRKAAARNLTRMTQLAEAAQQAKDAVSTLVGERLRASDAAAAARKADARRLAEARAEDRRVKALLRERARQAALAAQQNGETRGDSDGFLSYPVSGRITSPFGYRHHPIYGYWGLHDGVDFADGCGTAMRAPADGTVVSRYWSNSYGNRLIIDHGYVAGHGLATILNHATSYTVGAGEKVKRGQVVGYVGSTGWSTGCHLHFTVMQDGNPVDPMTWL